MEAAVAISGAACSLGSVPSFVAVAGTPSVKLFGWNASGANGAGATQLGRSISVVLPSADTVTFCTEVIGVMGTGPAETSRIGSPFFRLLLLPLSSKAVVAAVMVCGWVRTGVIAFHSARAKICAIVSKVCGVWPGPGMLCTCVPTGIMMDGTSSGITCAFTGAVSTVP